MWFYTNNRVILNLVLKIKLDEYLIRKDKINLRLILIILAYWFLYKIKNIKSISIFCSYLILYKINIL